ncbi:MAG: porin [Azoarcus sp.]|nr:porin [Azoarcus sp.]
MFTKIVALSLAALGTASAFAQSNITLYGVIDANVSTAKIGDSRFRGVQSGGLSASRIGFRGTEDLGNGVKVLFTLEYGLNTDTGNGITGARQSWVGLEGGFGFLGVGRQYSPGHNVSGAIDPFASSAALSPVLLTQGVNYQDTVYPVSTAATIQGGSGGRLDNALFYRTRDFGGLRFEAMYAFGEHPDQSNALGNRRAGNFYGLGGTWRNGPLTLGVAYHHTESTRFTFIGFDGRQLDKREWYMGGRYDFGPAELAASWQEIRSGASFSGLGTDNWRDRIWQVSGLVPINQAGSILAGYSRLNAEYSDEDVKVWTLAYTHAMSRRTTAYAGYRHVDNNDAAGSGALPGLRIDDNFGRSSQGLVLGVRHVF